MRNLVFIAVVVAAIVLLSLYIGRTTTVSDIVRETFSTEQQDVDEVHKIPAAVREKMGRARKSYDQKMEDAIDAIEK